MPKIIPIEIKMRAFCLYMYGLGPTKIVNLLKELGYADVPTPGSIDGWANEGVFTEKINWKLMRKACAPVFDHLARHDYERTSARDYTTWAEDTRSDLDKMQEAVMAGMKGMEFKPGDLPRIIAARTSIEQSAMERMNQIKMYLLAIGKIINSIAGITQARFKEPIVDEAFKFFMDRIIQDFEEFLRVGTHDPKRIMDGNYGLQGGTGFVAPTGNNGSEETRLQGPV